MIDNGRHPYLTKKVLRLSSPLSCMPRFWPTPIPDEEGIETGTDIPEDFGQFGRHPYLTKKVLRPKKNFPRYPPYRPTPIPDEEGIETDGKSFFHQSNGADTHT